MQVNIPIILVYALVLTIVVIVSVTAVFNATSENNNNILGPTRIAMCHTGSAFFDDTTPSVEYMSLNSMSSNSNEITNYCMAGYDMIKNKCSLLNTTKSGNEFYTDPKSIPRFIELCCNNDSTTCDLGALQCLFTQSDFMEDDYDLKNLNPTSFRANAEKVTKYCDNGYMNMINECTVPRQGTSTSNVIGSYSITGCIGNNCLVDIYGPVVQPQTSLTYRNICCNGSNNPSPSTCDRTSLACVLDGSDFYYDSLSLDQSIHRPTGNESIINKWCDVGLALDSADCQMFQPFQTANFSYGCCNGSQTISGCTTGARQCLFDSGKFKSKENSVSNMLEQPTIWYKNKSHFEEYCNLGKSLVERQCIHEHPLQTGNLFPTICCNGSTNIESCNTGAMNCLYNSSFFKDKDTYMTDQAYQSIHIDGSVAGFAGRNVNMTNEYCAAGNGLLTNNCVQTLINPLNSFAFQQFCCNGTKDPSVCQSTISPCISNGGSFINTDSNMSSQIVTNSNKEDVEEYCTEGITLLSNNCSTNPIDVSALYQNTSHTTFQDLCCGGTKNVSRCTTGEGGFQCAVDKTSFLQHSNSLDTITPSQIGGNLSSINNMCNLGVKMTNNDCQNYNPKSSISYVKYCCNNNKDTCDDVGFQCTSDFSQFSTSESIYKTMTTQSQIQANLDKIKTNYCDVGYRMITNGCVDSNVMTSTFDRLCCNNSNVCNTSSFQCTIDGSNFYVKDSGMNNVLDSGSQSYIDQYKKEYCDLGNKIISQGCMMVQPKSFGYFNQMCV